MLNILFQIITLGIFWTPSLEYLHNKANTSEDLAYYLSYFSYKTDVIITDHYKTPNEFVNDKGGDCEDFAIIGYEILKQKGYKVHIYLTGNSYIYDHCILYYEKDMDFGIISNSTRYPNMDVLGYCQNNYPNTYFNYKRIHWQTKRLAKQRN